MAIFAFAVCYLRSFIFPATPIVLWGDQIYFFDDGSRMSLGQLPYRDYFQIVPPGTDLIYALLIRLFGVSLWIPNLLMSCLSAAVASLMTLIAARIMQGAIIVLPGLLFAGIVLLTSMDATHHWFSTVAVLAAVLVFMPAPTWRRVANSGALCGIAALFTQTKGLLAIAAFLVCIIGTVKDKRWQKSLLLCGSAAAVFIAVNAYYISAAGLGKWLYCLLLYPLRYYSAPSFNNWRVVLIDAQLHSGAFRWVVVPFLCVAVLLTCIMLIDLWKGSERDNAERRRLLLLATVAFAMFLTVSSAPSVKRVCTASPPAVILLVWGLGRRGRADPGWNFLLGSVAVVLAIVTTARTQIRPHQELNLPGGRAAFLHPDEYELYSWLLKNTDPGQYFFGLPPLYTPFHFRNPAPIEGVDPSDYTRPEQVSAVVEALQNCRVPLLVLRQSRIYLFAKKSASNHLGPLQEYISRNYQLTKTFRTGDEVWQRKRSDSP
jgi:hypothetical protein